MEDGKNRTKWSVKYTSYWKLNQLAGGGGRGWKEPHEVEREVHQLLGVISVSWGGGRGWKEPHEVEREVHQLFGS